MRINQFVLGGLIAIASSGLASQALANGRNPGSLLLYPEFDNHAADLTLLTVTNTNTGIGNPGGVDGTVKVEFVYIGKRDHNGLPLNCLEFNRTETLTANDTLTVITYLHNPQHEDGYVYVFAKDKVTGKAISFNYLIGNLVSIEGITALEYSMNPVAFSAIPPFGGNTDIDNAGAGDGVRDLDGVEYEKVADEIYIPRFIGWGAPAGASPGSAIYKSELILIALSGGTAFTTLVNFVVYNDNEEAFSAQYTFHCWDRQPLNVINGVFTQDFLRSTNQNPNEIVGAPSVEAGWIRVNGGAAWSTTEQITDPAVYAVLIEKIANVGAADLPFESTATQANGDLLPTGVCGDPSGNCNDNQ